MSAKPILVTGSHRSGTTWVGEMIAASPSVVYIHEPFNISYPDPGKCSARFDKWFTYICDRNEQDYYISFKRMVNFRYNLMAQVKISKRPSAVANALEENARFIRYRLTNARPLIKDPIAFFSAEWLASRFGMDTVVMIRHPAAFAASIKEKNWAHPFDHFLQQPLLMDSYLSPFKSQIMQYAEEEQDILDQAALLWNMIHYTILRYREKHPEWIFLRHEDISRDPCDGFAKLYACLNLNYSENVKLVIREHCSSSGETGLHKHKINKQIKRDSASNIWTWKTRLTTPEIQRLKSQVQDISQEFYSEQEW
jgi:hypothetical protein